MEYLEGKKGVVQLLKIEINVLLIDRIPPVDRAPRDLFG
jgi:hypothetical protein